MFCSKYNEYKLKSISDCKIIINGKEYQSLNDTFDEIKNISSPTFGITCHGDPQPSNIIISNKNKWYLVDWEWSGKNHDFRLMFSHLYGWWVTRMINIKNTPEFIVENNKLIINYEICKNELIDKFQLISNKVLKKYFDISVQDEKDINRFLALLYLGDIRFLDIWDKPDYLPILIGEATKTVNYLKFQSEDINLNFTYKNEGDEYE